MRVSGYKTGNTLPRAHGCREEGKGRMDRRRSKACLRGKSPRAHKACYAVDARSWRRCPAGLPCWAGGSHAPRQSHAARCFHRSKGLPPSLPCAPPSRCLESGNGKEESRGREEGKGRREGREGGRVRPQSRQAAQTTHQDVAPPVGDHIALHSKPQHKGMSGC